MMTIGDYYERKDRERRAAWDKWQKAIQAHKENPTYETYCAMLKAEDEATDAGNTGD